MVLMDDETVAAIQAAFDQGGVSSAVAELRRRFWMLNEESARDTVERVVLWRRPKQGEN